MIFLEHYTIRLSITRKATNNGNNYSVILKRNFGLFGKSKSEIVLESDETRGVIDVSSEVLREWVDVLKKKVIEKRQKTELLLVCSDYRHKSIWR